MKFRSLLLQAKAGGQKEFIELMEMYKPLLVKNAIYNGNFDEDLYQELCITLLRCIRMFHV